MRRYEFWHPKIFEFPWYVYTGLRCILSGIHPYTLLKANYGLEEGGINSASKYEMQKALGENIFPKTILLKNNTSKEKKEKAIRAFAKKYNYPVVLKPDHGCCGKAVIILKDKKQKLGSNLQGDYLCQAFIKEKVEFGVFYIRYKSIPRIFSINGKVLPFVTGDGKSTIKQLCEKKENYSTHWNAFLKNTDTNKIPKKGEHVQLSTIGSHTLGSIFTEKSHLITEELKKSIFKLFKDKKGFNYGRVDVKANSEEELKKGKCKVIEVNGIHSLSTNIFDPHFSIWKAYSILFKQSDWWVKIAKEHKDKPMKRKSVWAFLKRYFSTIKELDKEHKRLLGVPQ